MGDDDRQVTKVKVQDHEKHKQAHPHENLRHDHRHEDEGFEGAVDGEALAVEHPGSQRAEDGGQEGGSGADHQTVAEGVEQHPVVEEGFVPFQGEPLLAEAGLGLVEGEDDQQDNGKIKKGKDQGRPTSPEPADQRGSVRAHPTTGCFSRHR